jgi:vitamin B12 transporter
MKRTTLPGSVIAALGTAAAPWATYAQTVDEEVVTIGQRLEETIPQSLERLGNRLETLSSEDIDLGGFNDVGQTLQMGLPSLYVAPKNGPFDYLNCSLQGSRCEDLLFLIDGVRIANRLYNTTSPLDTIPAHAVERIEVLYGGQGIFYGTQSVAGVVNVVTRAFSDEPRGSIGIGFDEYNGTHVSADYGTSVGDHSLVLYLSQDESDGFQPFADEDYQPSASDRERGYDVLSFGAKYGYDISDVSRISVLYQHTDNELDNALPYQAAVRNNARVEDLLTAKWDYAIGDNVDFYIKAYYHDWDTKWDDIRNEIAPDGSLTGNQIILFQDAFWGYEDYGITALADIATGDAVELSVGYDYQRFWGNDEVWLIEDKTETAQAVYAQIRSAAGAFDRSDLAFGVRYNSTSGSADGTVWNVSGRHEIGARFFLRGQLGTSFRLPDAEELYLRDCCEVGNPDLESEESRNLEIAFGRGVAANDRLSWQIVYFAREVDNLIGVDFDNPAYPDGIFANFADTVEFEGWEFAVESQIGDFWRTDFSLTKNDAMFAGTVAQIDDVPKSLLKFGLTYRAPQRPLELRVSAVHVGDVYDTVGGGVGRREHGNYTVLDLSGAYYLDEARRHRLGARLENVLDETYATSLGRGRFDLDNSSYAYRNLGAPRTLNLSYAFNW